MKRFMRFVADTLFYFEPLLLIGVLGVILLCFVDRIKSTVAGQIVAIVFGVLWLVTWFLWARLTPCRRKWDILAPIAAAVCPLYLWWLFCLYDELFVLFLLYPANLFLIVPTVIIFVVTFFASSTYFRANTTKQVKKSSTRKGVFLRVIAVVAGCTLLAIPPACVATVSTHPQLNPEYAENVLAYYRAEHGDIVKTRAADGTNLYELEGLSTEEFLGTNRITLWDGAVPQVIMHPSVQEPLFTFPLRSLRFAHYEQEDVAITDAQTLSAFRAFILDENNGIAIPSSGEYSTHTVMTDDNCVQLFFDVPCNMYWFADCDIQDGKVMVYGRLHKSEKAYAYDVTHILGEYLL